jgi:hypothetical protein
MSGYWVRAYENNKCGRRLVGLMKPRLLAARALVDADATPFGGVKDASDELSLRAASRAHGAPLILAPASSLRRLPTRKSRPQAG